MIDLSTSLKLSVFQYIHFLALCYLQYLLSVLQYILLIAYTVILFLEWWRGGGGIKLKLMSKFWVNGKSKLQQGEKGNLIHIYAYIFYRAFLVEGAAGKPPSHPRILALL